MDDETIDRLWAAHLANEAERRASMASFYRRAHDLERQFAEAGLPFVFDFERGMR